MSQRDRTARAKRWAVSALFASIILLAFIGVSYWRRLAAPELGGVPACSVAVPATASRFGELTERQLPWWPEEPAALRAARTRYGAVVFKGAFFVDYPASGESEAYNVALATRRLAGTVLGEGEEFSFNRSLGPFTAERGYRPGQTYVGGQVIDTEGGGVCRVSSMLYNLAVLTRLEVLERHPHSMPVPYLPPGRDAAVAYGGKDLRIAANEPIVLWAAVQGSTAYIAAYGRHPAPKVTWHQEVRSRQPFAIRRRYNPQLPPGEERIVVPGAEGVVVHNWVEVTHPDGRTERVDLGTDRYWPLPQVVEVGP